MHRTIALVACVLTGCTISPAALQLPGFEFHPAGPSGMTTEQRQSIERGFAVIDKRLTKLEKNSQ